MTRYEEPVEITLTPDQAAHLDNNGRGTDSSQLTVLVSGYRITARWPARTGFDNPPSFAGRVQQGSDGVTVVGSVRESLANTLWSRIMRIVTLAMIALAIFGAVLLITNGAHDGLAPLLIGALAAPPAALLWRRFRRLRRPNFEADADRLRVGLARYLISGDGTRRAS
jgi:hypothetical protein